MTPDDRVLVAIMNNLRDYVLAQDQHWYRIPINEAEKWAKNCWPPQWLAFYQTKIFSRKAFAINYYCQVLDIEKAYRSQLFPDEYNEAKATRHYYKLILGPLEPLAQPILSRRLRRIVFIPTTWQKFTNACEINDLYHESPLEDRLWAELKRLEINAERQEHIKANGHNYILDFAIYCNSGYLAVETDGDAWHSDASRIPEDNVRGNDLGTIGWRLLRFNTLQIRERMDVECLPMIKTNINNLGGLSEGLSIPKSVGLSPFDERVRRSGHTPD